MSTGWLRRTEDWEVTRPFPFVVTLQMWVASPQAPGDPLTVARVVAEPPDVVTSPVRLPTASPCDPEPKINCPLVSDAALVTQVGQAIAPAVVMVPPVIGPVVATAVTEPPPPP